MHIMHSYESNICDDIYLEIYLKLRFLFSEDLRELIIYDNSIIIYLRLASRS